MNSISKSCALAALWALSLLGASGAAIAQEVRTYFVTDGVGSPVVATDMNGNTVWTEDYLPYGDRRFKSSSAHNEDRWFTAGSQNADTGLIYLGHRFMDPVQGRFLSIDPSDPSLLDGGNFNRYWYGANNPICTWIPTGETSSVFGLGTTSVRTTASYG
jgi:RHS repeat-associated protein